MINEIKLCDPEQEEDPYQPGTIWAHEEDPELVFMIINHGYIDLSKGTFYASIYPKRDLSGYTQVYCITIKRDRSG